MQKGSHSSVIQFLRRLLSLLRNDKDDKDCNVCSVNRHINLANVKNRYYNIHIKIKR